jgi:F-type H+-transporting ATPase subunit c
MKLVKCAVMALGLFLLAQAPASAQTTAAPTATGVRAPAAPLADVRAIGAGLVIIGAALGIGGLTRSAVESMARQPEMAGNVQTAMIISAALIEGVTFFALIIILLQSY